MESERTVALAITERDVEGAVPYDLRTDGDLVIDRREARPLTYGIKIPFVADKRYIIATRGSNII